MPLPSQDPGNRNSVAINAFSRVISVIMLTLVFGVGGSYLDKWLGTGYWTFIGFIIGGILTMVGLLYVVKAAEYDRKHPQGSGEEIYQSGDASERGPDPKVDDKGDQGL